MNFRDAEMESKMVLYTRDPYRDSSTLTTFLMANVSPGYRTSQLSYDDIIFFSEYCILQRLFYKAQAPQGFGKRGRCFLEYCAACRVVNLAMPRKKYEKRACTT